MLSPQDFARLLQDKLIEAGESRPLEFRADLFGFVPRGGDLASIFPLDNYYRAYLSAQSDGERQRAVKQFTGDWLRHARSNAPVSAGAAGAPSGSYSSPGFVVPNPLAGGPPPAMGSAYRPPPRSVSSGGRTLLVVFGAFGLAVVGLCLFSCVLPAVMMGVAKNRMRNMPGGGPVGQWGRDWDFDPPPEATVTEFVGGPGGGQKCYFDRGQRPVVGLAYSTGEWFGQQCVGSLVPLYDAQQAPRSDFGEPLIAVRAKEGYVVGGLEVDGAEYVNAVRVTFVRQTDQGLDPADTYQSEWLGTPTPGREAKKLAGAGEEVLGIAARQGIVLDGVALILKRPAAAVPNGQPEAEPESPAREGDGSRTSDPSPPAPLPQEERGASEDSEIYPEP